MFFMLPQLQKLLLEMSSSLFISSLLSSGQQLVWPREILSTIYWPLSEVFYTGKEKKR